MSITSFQFLIFFLLSIAIYYAIPKRFQWCALLIFSACFFVLSSTLYTGIYLVISIVTTTICAVKIGKSKEANSNKSAKIFLFLGIVLNIGILAVLKYSNFLIVNFNIISLITGNDIRFGKTSFLSPMGISFYSMIIVGYLLDCYWGISDIQKNFFKTALFIGYYPQLTSGPVTRYNDVNKQLYESHSFDWKSVTFGMQRMLWGVFKKLVISAKIGVLVDTIYADTLTYDGLYIWFAALAFMLQLYTDFSGCMDIIIGASQCYGIILPENFRTPFFSRSVQEYWQRWHITLGSWLKDYILYPILRSGAWRNLNKWTKNHFGKKAAKQLPSYLGMLCVWLLIGLWHGGSWKYIIGMGIWFWLCIVLAQVLDPLFKKIIRYMKINTVSFSWHLFQSLRVFVLVSIGNMFFRLNSLREAVTTIKIGFSHWNPEIFFDGSLYKLGLSEKDFRLTLFCLLILLFVSVLQEKESIRERLAKQNLVFRWIVLFVLIFSIVLFGMYGPGYDAQSFIYEGF